MPGTEDDPLNLTYCHVAVAARCALDLHTALVVAYDSAPLISSEKTDLFLLIIEHNAHLHYLADLVNWLSPKSFTNNLGTSLHAAADNWRP